MAKQPKPPPKPVTLVEKPLVIVYQKDGEILYELHPPPGFNHEVYGLLICDLIRNVAKAYAVPESAVFRWVEKEYRHPTLGDLTQWKIN